MALRILTVDDSASIRTLLATILGAAGYDVVAASGAREALRCLRSFEPHVILTDYNMPGIDGHGFVRLLRRKCRYDDTAILVLSSETETFKRDCMKDAGANGWFSKPVRTELLLAGIRTAGDASRRVSQVPEALGGSLRFRTRRAPTPTLDAPRFAELGNST